MKQQLLLQATGIIAGNAPTISSARSTWRLSPSMARNMFTRLEESNSPKHFEVMKHIISYIILIAASTLLWSCVKSDDENCPTPVKVEEPTWTVDLSGTESAPTTWVTPSSGVYQYSMTAIITLSDFLAGYADSGDQVSAFIGSECRGIAKPQTVNGKTLFFLYIRGNSAETQKVSLKYYSAKNKITYTCANVV